MEERKEYIIRIFIKKCILTSVPKEQLEFYFKWCASTYNVSEEKLKELEEKFTIEEYINRIIPAIDECFSIEELKDIIKFYSTAAGKKLLDRYFLKKVETIGSDMQSQIEQEFVLNNNKS